MKLTALSVAVAGALSSGAALAEATGNIGVTSNYIWRGLTQTSDAAAVQGGLDYAHDSGFYVGTWLSNVDFTGMDGEYEMDLYAGFAGEAGDFGYDIGVFHYMYPLTDDVDFTEIGVSGSFSVATVGVNYIVSSDLEDSAYAEGDLYAYLDLGFDLTENSAFGLHVGSTDFDYSGAEDYVDYGATLSMSDFTFGVSMTDLDDDDPRAYVSYGMSFDL